MAEYAANEVTDPRNGYFDIVYSPDDGGWYASLWYDRKIDPPVFATAERAEKWALRHGGKQRLQ